MNPALRQLRTDVLAKLNGRRIVASISGGKDSAALSLWLTELELEHDRVFLDTGWEHPLTYEYLRGELTRVLGPITELRGEHDMVQLIRQKQMFPSRTRRFCTQELKVRPMQRYLNARMEAGEDVVNAVGIRREESAARSSALEWEHSDGFDCEVWRPLVSWTFEDVVAIHQRHSLKPNPLYLMGASRVGCWPCICARKGEIKLVADTDPGRIDEIRRLEDELTGWAKAPRAWFQAPLGRKGVWPIDEVVRWSRTAQGGRQFELFEASPADSGCMRWGLCDTGASNTEDEANP
jgi:3'-phosphoadenosine 5'-phosphosulfate sulfotransferase (PAPS reductase)/FAD synthetase